VVAAAVVVAVVVLIHHLLIHHLLKLEHNNPNLHHKLPCSLQNTNHPWDQNQDNNSNFRSFHHCLYPANSVYIHIPQRSHVVVVELGSSFDVDWNH